MTNNNIQVNVMNRQQRRTAARTKNSNTVFFVQKVPLGSLHAEVDEILRWWGRDLEVVPGNAGGAQ